MNPPDLKSDEVDHLIECFREDLTELTDDRRCLFFRDMNKDYKGFVIDVIEVMVDFKSTIPTQDEISKILDLIEEALNRSDILYSFMRLIMIRGVMIVETFASIRDKILTRPGMRTRMTHIH